MNNSLIKFKKLNCNDYIYDYNDYFNNPYIENNQADFNEYIYLINSGENELNLLFDKLENELDSDTTILAKNLIDKTNLTDNELNQLKLIVSYPIKPKGKNSSRHSYPVINSILSKSENTYKTHLNSLCAKFSLLGSSVDPIIPERVNILKELSFYASPNVVWKEYKSRRDSDLNSIIKEYNNKPTYILKCIKTMKELITYDYKVVTSEDSFGFNDLGTTISLLQELYQDSYTSIVNEFFTRKQIVRSYSSTINIASKNVQHLKQGQTIYLLDDHKNFIMRAATVILAKPNKICLTYEDNPSIVNLEKVCYINKIEVQKEDLQPLMDILFPVEGKVGYYQCGIIININGDKITLLYKNNYKLTKKEIDIPNNIILGSDMYGCDDFWKQIISIVFLLDSYINYLGELCNKEHFNKIDDIKYRPFAFPLNNCETLINKTITDEWSRIIKLIEEIEPIDYWYNVIEYEGENTHNKYKILPITLELLSLAKLTVLYVKTHLFGTIDHNGRGIMKGIRISFELLYNTIINHTYEGLKRNLSALSSFIFLVREDIFNNICIIYYIYSKRNI